MWSKASVMAMVIFFSKIMLWYVASFLSAIWPMRRPLIVWMMVRVEEGLRLGIGLGQIQDEDPITKGGVGLGGEMDGSKGS